MQTTNENFTVSGESLHPLLLKYLDERHPTLENKKDFLSWDLKQLPLLGQLKDLEKASNRIVEAIESDEKLAIYGDYDIDGTTSCALLYHFFKMIGKEVMTLQPSRFVEGYGIHPPTIEMAKEENIALVITVDCGITADKAAEKAKELGVDLIITDHHKDGLETMPPAFAIINPNRRDETDDELKSLAGVGVAFALALEIKKTLEKKGHQVPSLYPLLQFVAIGTVGDLVPLGPANLKLVRHGLKQIPSSQYPGIQAFLSNEERKLSFLPSEKIAFFIGPRINSKGRMDHPERALELLKAATLEEAKEHFHHIEVANDQRKYVQSEVAKEAKDLIIRSLYDEDPVVNILYKPHWHEGVVGIVASKMVELFSVPCIILTDAEEEGVMKGSARTAGELDIYSSLKECEKYFEKFGGHKAAAGLSLKKNNFPLFALELKKVIEKTPAILRTKQLDYDLACEGQEINPQLVRQLSFLEPFGTANPKPIFNISGLKVAEYKVLKEAHVKWSFVTKSSPSRNLQGISFFYFDKWNEPAPEKIQSAAEISVLGTLDINRFNGREYIQIQVIKILI